MTFQIREDKEGTQKRRRYFSVSPFLYSKNLSGIYFILSSISVSRFTPSDAPHCR